MKLIGNTNCPKGLSIIRTKQGNKLTMEQIYLQLYHPEVEREIKRGKV